MRIGWFSTRGINPSETAVRVRGRSHLDEVCALGSGKDQVLAARSTREEVVTLGSNGDQVRTARLERVEVLRDARSSARGGPDGWISEGKVQRSGSEAGLRSVKGATRGGGLDRGSLDEGRSGPSDPDKGRS